MSTVLWLSLESDPEDFAPDDLGCLFDELSALDQHCSNAKVKPLSEFLDSSDFLYNTSDEDLGEEWLEANAKWVNPEDLLTSLRAVEGILSQSEDEDDLLDEVRYAADRCVDAQRQGARVRLIVVM